MRLIPDESRRRFGGVTFHLTYAQRRERAIQIVLDYLWLGTYRAVAKQHNISVSRVREILKWSERHKLRCPDCGKPMQSTKQPINHGGN